MNRRIEDTRIQSARALIPPAILIEEFPMSEASGQFVAEAREEVADCVGGTSRRLLVVVGPCSIHDPQAALDYAGKLIELKKDYEAKLVLVMRCYFEKPRTVVGWKGYINDPLLDGSHKINTGLREARSLLTEITNMRIPAATEFLDPSIPQYISDHIAWGAIGARTCESQPHRELASGLSMPVGIKNPTDGRLQAAVDAVLAARQPHWFAGSTRDGIVAHFQSTGNDTCHVILRGGSKSGPNYSSTHIDELVALLGRASLPQRVMIDCAHGNSGKDEHKQLEVAKDVAKQMKEGSDRLIGVMVESNIAGGRQDWSADGSMTYGKSVTDPCLSIEDTKPLLDVLAGAVR